MNKFIISVFFLFCTLAVTPGQTTESFLEKVRENHPAIVAAKQLLVSDKAESRTGTTPENPVISAGYFPGNDVAGENKFTWGVSQSLDFPARYTRIKKLKQSNLKLAKMEYELTVLQLMSEARQSAINYISVLADIKNTEDRIETLEKLDKAYSVMLREGETTIIEHNKIVIKLVEFQSALALLKAGNEELKAKLDIISLNNSSILETASLPAFNEPVYTELEADLKARHPAFLLPEIRKDAADIEISLSKAANMPGFVLGYSSEIVGNTRFTGPSLGLSLPLWKNKGKVRKAIESSAYQQKLAESEIMMLVSYFGSVFNNYLATCRNLNLVNKTIDSSNNRALLDKALDAGEINLTEYFLELEAIYQLEDLSIELNNKKHSLLSQLFELDFTE